MVNGLRAGEERKNGTGKPERVRSIFLGQEQRGRRGHSFGTLLKENGADLKLIQSLMRHNNVSVTADRYVQSTTSAKREAQLNG